jgi:hypothetical protein
MSVQLKIDKRPMPSEALMPRVAAKLDVQYTGPHYTLLRLARRTGCHELDRIEELNRYVLAYLADSHVNTYKGSEHGFAPYRRDEGQEAARIDSLTETKEAFQSRILGRAVPSHEGYPVSPMGYRAAEYAARCEATPLGSQDYRDGYRTRLAADEQAVSESMFGFEDTPAGRGIRTRRPLVRLRARQS